MFKKYPLPNYAEPTTVNDHKSTTALPEATRTTAGQGVDTDSESQPQNPTSNNVNNAENQSSGSGCSYHSITGLLMGTMMLAIVTFI